MYNTSTDGETNLLFTAIRAHWRNPAHEQDCAQLLAVICQNDSYAFLQICYDFISFVIQMLFQPLSKLQDDKIIMPTVIYLNVILTLIWKMQLDERLVNLLHKAQNALDNAIGENKKSKDNYIRQSRADLETFRRILEEILAQYT